MIEPRSKVAKRRVASAEELFTDKLLVSNLQNKIESNELFTAIDGQIFKSLLSDLTNCFDTEPALIADTQREQIEKFCKALSFHLLITNWDSMIYVPSEVLLPGQTKPFGFGGLILAEENKGDEILNYYLSKRAEMLRVAINMKFRAIGAGQWADKAVKEVTKKINLLEQTYHDINRRYIPSIKSFEQTKEIATLIENKITYLRLLAQGSKEKSNHEIKIKDEIKKIFSLLRFEDKVKFNLDLEQFDDAFKFKGHGGAFISLFENLIGNTCRHALSRNKIVKIQIYRENNFIYYKDDGKGFPATIDGVDIFEKINNWFKGFFSEMDMKERAEGKSIRGMGLYIANEAANFLGWEIIPIKPDDNTNPNTERVQIVFKIGEVWNEKVSRIY